MNIPGFRVFRWERYWHVEWQPFIEPSDYPEISVATSGTHDTDTMMTWWETSSPAEREQVAALNDITPLLDGGTVTRDVLLEVLMASRSNLVLFPIQDVFGWRDRINEPGTVNDRNWTFRLPWPSNILDSVAEARDRQTALRRWAQQYGRL